MKTLKDHVILYDAVCPMCNLYTKGFIEAGMLDKNGRLPYQTMPDKIANRVDKNRCVNEIALVHTPTGTVYYGVESLLRIITYSFPGLAFLATCKPFRIIVDKLYKFISFNRRVIIPSKKDESNPAYLDPAFHKGYRIVYLVFTWIVTSFLLSQYTENLRDMLPAGSLFREAAICAGQIVWQFFMIQRLSKSGTWDYLGNMMTISLAGAIFLGIVMLVGNLMDWQSPVPYLIFFLLTVTLMFVEHIRRVKFLGLSSWMTVSWVAYRFVVLIILYIFFYAG